MRKKLVSKDVQIKQLEQEAREICKEILVKRSFNIMYPAGILMVSNPDNVINAMKILDMVLEGMAVGNINLQDDVTKESYEEYTTSDRTVQNICNLLEDLESCVKCDEQVKEAIVELLNEWQLCWITYRLKKAEILGLMGNEYSITMVNVNGVNKFYFRKYNMKRVTEK